MRDDTRFWPTQQESVLLRFQPVFTARGQVHEYAVLGRCRPSPWSGLNPKGLGAGLEAGVAFFKKFKTAIDLSFEHPLDVTGSGDPAERLCLELGICLVGDALWVNKHPLDESSARLTIPTKRVTFTVPLSEKISDRTSALNRCSEFQPRLRVQLLPCVKGGQPSSSGVLRAQGLHVQVPLGLSQNRSLQGRFFALMERAWSANLQVVADGVDDIRDFAWMRLHSDLLFRGTVLSAALSPECLDTWLQADSAEWRSFSACTTRFEGMVEE
ncbi:hypothetical protein RAS12_27550 [Achromobacter seleniivolatilans]|uniref:EAL domain-containing protein n=1 Tax=Achromobacter seleniivolatilans TaxID=3047478 RepID=A0ABY9LZX6_9BURK|nr:hypothetical protein [Achromobacter sp. R39]WMD20319.1 hypothetical protein RAS12_27550 [Achromobacter sp. R39]